MSAPARPEDRLVPVGARAPLLDGAVSTGEALGTILFEALAHISANVPVVTVARDSEGLHQLRVGLRRLRTGLKLAGLGDLEVRAKTLINAVGPARDCDVFLDEMFAPVVAELGPRRGFEILEARAKAQRADAWAAAIAALSDGTLPALEDDIAKAARALAEPAGKAIGETAPDILDRALNRAQKRGRRFAELDAPARHRLRIALKRLRYAAEFFAPLYDKKDVKRWLAPLKELQDLLGHLNDVAQVRAMTALLITGDAGEQADASHAAGLMTGFYQTRSEGVLEQTAKRWKSFRATAPFWD